MKIVICVKQIHQVYCRSGVDPQRYFLRRRDYIHRINPYDEAALETALRIKDLLPETVIYLLTMGELIAEEELRRCLALGADAIYRIDIDSSLDSRTKSIQLASAAQKLGADLILCGKESMDRQNGQVAALMAHWLDLPFVSAIVDLEYAATDNSITATRSGGRGRREKIRCPLPAVLSVDLGMFTYRVPWHADLETASTAPIQTVLNLPGPMEPAVSVLKTMPPRPRTMQAAAPDSSLKAIDRIQLLLTGSKIEKKGEMLEGDPDTLVAGIMDYLSKHGFLET